MKKLFYLFLAYLPFQLALNVFPGFDVASGRIIIILFFLITSIEFLRKKDFQWEIRLMDLFLSGLLFFMCFSILFAQNFDWSIRKILFLLSITPIYFLVRNFIVTKKDLKVAFEWVVFGGFLAAVLGIIQFSSQFVWGIDKTYHFWATNILPFFSGQTFSLAILANSAWLVNISGKTLLRASSLFPDPHMFSFYLNLILGINLFVLIKSRNKKTFWWLTLIIIILANLLTFSRGGYLGLLGGGLILLLFLLKKSSVLTKSGYLFSLVVILFVIVSSGWFSDRLNSSFNLREGSNQQRLETWEKALNVLRENSILGVGIGNYPLQIKPNANYREPIYAHSNYLDIALDGGIGALFFWLLIIFYSIFDFFKKSQKDLAFAGLLFSLVAFSVHSVFETSIYSITTLPLFLVIISLASFGVKNKDA